MAYTVNNLNDYDLGYSKGLELAKRGVSEIEALEAEQNEDIREGIKEAYFAFLSNAFRDSARSLKLSLTSISDSNSPALRARMLHYACDCCDLARSLKALNINHLRMQVQSSLSYIKDSEEYSLEKVNNKHYKVLKDGVPMYDLEQKQSRWTCTCTGYKYRHRCKHLALLQDILPKRHPRSEFEGALPKIAEVFEGFTYEIVGSWRRGKCFAAGTKVRTYHGYKSIEEVEVGDLIFNGEGKLTTVTDKVSYINSDWVDVKYRRASSIRCTPDHKFLIWKNNSPRKDFEWERADDLGTSHWKMVIPRLELPQDISIGTTYAFLLGWYLSDGNMAWVPNNDARYPYKGGGIYHVNFACNSLRCSEFLHMVAELGLRNFSFISNPETNEMSINVRDEALIEFMLSWGGIHAPKLDEDKRPSWDILRLQEDEKLAFTQGFWLGDGTYGKYNTSESVRFYNTNKDIIEILDLVLSTKYKTLRYFDQRSNDGYKDMYEVRLSGRDARDFVVSMPEMYSDAKYLDTRIKQWKSTKEVTKQFSAWGQNVSSVETVESYSAPCYCLTVEEGSSFIAEGFAVHNCDFKDVDILVACTKSDMGTIFDRLQADPSYKHTMAGPDIIRGSYQGYDFDVTRANPNEWGSYLLYRTGSMSFNIALRGWLKKFGYSLNEHGLYDPEGNKLASKSEEDIFKAIGIPYIKPEDREDTKRLREELSKLKNGPVSQ